MGLFNRKSQESPRTESEPATSSARPGVVEQARTKAIRMRRKTVDDSTPAPPAPKPKAATPATTTSPTPNPAPTSGSSSARRANLPTIAVPTPEPTSLMDGFASGRKDSTVRRMEKIQALKRGRIETQASKPLHPITSLVIHVLENKAFGPSGFGHGRSDGVVSLKMSSPEGHRETRLDILGSSNVGFLIKTIRRTYDLDASKPCLVTLSINEAGFPTEDSPVADSTNIRALSSKGIFGFILDPVVIPSFRNALLSPRVASNDVYVEQSSNEPEDERVDSESVSICVFGASGDLAKKKTYPALFHLFAGGWIKPSTIIYGFARSEMSDNELRERIRPFLAKEAGARGTKDKVEDFLSKCKYVAGPYDRATGFEKLEEIMSHDEKKAGGVFGRIFYLALPPDVFPQVGAQIKSCLMTDTSRGAYNRVVVEKPFGHDLASSNVLAEQLGALFTEDEVYRIDHYLGKELVQNIMMMRFTNTFFSSLWDRDSISCVQITFKENFGTTGRGGYFDKSGIIRDILQNHLLQVMAIVAMEPPSDSSPEAIRDAKTHVLKQTREIDLEDVVLGQYLAGGGEPAYLDDEGVPKDSITPTFATCVLHIDNLRWKGVPFILKAGKALDERKAEIRIQFKEPPTAGILNSQPSRNELVIRLQPSEAIYMKVNTKSPGLSTNILESELDLTYQDRYKDITIPDAYERLILDVIRGDHQHFVRRDELTAAWEIFTPMLHKLVKKNVKPIPYDFGSRGPKESDVLIQKYGYIRSSNYTWKNSSASHVVS